MKNVWFLYNFVNISSNNNKKKQTKIQLNQYLKIFQDMDEEVKQSANEELEYEIDNEATLSNAEDMQSLVHQAKNFKMLLDDFKKQPFLSRPFYYILSAKWLRRWKTYVSYDSCVSAAPPGKYFGRGTLPKINQNIVNATPQIPACYSQPNQHLNVVLKPGLVQQRDYVLLTQDMWSLFTKYDHIEVKRYVAQTDDGKKVQLYFQEVTLVPVYAEFLKEIQREKSHKLMHLKFQVSHYATISQFEDLVKNKLKDFVSANTLVYFPANISVRMWLLPEDTRPNILVNMLMTGCKANPTFSYKIYTDGEYLQPQKRVCDYDIFNSSLIMVELQQEKSNWIFWNSRKPFVGECGGCKNFEELRFVCSCKYALYCSKSCKNGDKSHHKFRCPNDCESDEEEVEIRFNDHSRYGLVGLRNLGNTCFMNSGLQCLSHVMELTQYFLEDKYLKQINKENPLGTKGQLSTAYAKLLKNLWMGSDSSVSPTQLKRAIGKFQPMFMGYNQHDSGQLISYLLDGIHEDLNRIKNKPYTQSKDYDGRPDQVIAKESWELFLKRNSSVIVDLMYGQFKSIVDCPICQYESIQFDPFLMCTLPIVNDNMKKIDVVYLKDNFHISTITVCYDASWGWKISHVIQDVKKKLNLGQDTKMIAFMTSYSVCEPLSLDQTIQKIQYQCKYRSLCIRQQYPWQTPQHDIAITLANVICHSYYGNQSYRKNITPYTVYYFSRKTTLQQVHQRIYSFYRELYPVTDYEQEVINVEQKEQPFRFLTIPSSRYTKCEYCCIKGCEGCVLKYDKETILGDILSDEKNKIQMELYWRKNDKEIEKKFDQLKANGKGDSDDKDSKKKSGTTIQQCFKLFEKPEILAQDNAWYCPKCKDLVLAKKQMQIYKAPKILILCLKRFKRKQYYAEKYNIMVDFPLQSFDISEYVINHDLPEEYFTKENQNNSKKPQLLYDLIGITNHFGGTGGGHYTAYCEDPRSKKWYDFDDSCVDQLKSPEDAVTESAYMLYYKRRE